MDLGRQFNTNSTYFDTSLNNIDYLATIFVSSVSYFIVSFVTFGSQIGLEALSCFLNFLPCSGLHVDCQNALAVSLLCHLLCCLEHGFEHAFFFVYLGCSSRKHNRIQNRFD